MTYPPYCDLCVLGFTGNEESAVRIAANKVILQLKELTGGEYKEQKIIVLGPVPARVSKVSGKYRYRIIIKCINSVRLRQMISGLLKHTASSPDYKNVTVYADMNPDTML